MKKRSTIIWSLNVIKKGMKIYTGLTLIFALVILIGSIPISDSRSIDIGGAGGARVPPEFGCSEKGQSLISAYRSLAITTNTAGFKRLSMSLDRLISEGFYLPTHKFLKNILHCKCFVCWIHRWMPANQIQRQLALILTD